MPSSIQTSAQTHQTPPLLANTTPPPPRPASHQRQRTTKPATQETTPTRFPESKETSIQLDQPRAKHGTSSTSHQQKHRATSPWPAANQAQPDRTQQTNLQPTRKEVTQGGVSSNTKTGREKRQDTALSAHNCPAEKKHATHEKKHATSPVLRKAGQTNVPSPRSQHAPATPGHHPGTNPGPL